MNDRARLWQRVSSGGQDEASQLPDLIKWCDSHSYEYDLSERYVLHGKSASKGKHQAELDRALDDMAAGKYTVLVVWQSSRIERRGAFSAFDLARRVREAGGRIEYVKDAYLNETNEMSDVMLALAATKDRQKSLDISKQVKAKHDALRAAGSIVGCAPWGYEIVREDGRKVLVPTADGKKYIPLIFDRVIRGESLRTIARWLDSEGVAPMNGGRWHEGFIGNRLIKNRTYMGQRPNAGSLETPALVSATTWQAANAALTARVRPGRSTTIHPKTLLAPVCGNCYGKEREGCPSGISPMYRVMPRAAEGPLPYYRCTGHGPQRKGCGSMVRAAELDARVRDIIGTMDKPHIDRVFVPGDDNSDRIAKAQERGAAAMRAGNYQAAMEAMREAEQIEAEPRTAARWDMRETGQTEAEFFAGLDLDGQREYLARWDVLPVTAKGKFAVLLGAPWQTETGEVSATMPTVRKAAVSASLVAKLEALRSEA